MASNPTPHFLAEDHSQVLFNVTLAFTILSTLVYILFLVSRAFCAERNSWEIWVFTGLAYTFNIGLWAIGFGGAGRHSVYWFLTDPTVIETYLKLQTAAEFVYMAACLFPKLSILALYLRIFTQRSVRIIAWIVIGVCIAHAVANNILSFTICQPFEFKWNKTINGHCANILTSYRWVSLPHIISDIAILTLPLSSLYQLQINKRKKLGILFTFAIGGLGIITAIVRFVKFWKVDLEVDPTWYSPDLFSFTIIEPNVYLMCSCFIHLRPLLRVVCREVRAKMNSYYGTTTGKSSHTELTLINLKGNHSTPISASKNISTRVDENHDRFHFIRLDESVDVDVLPRSDEERV
ncbi:hypothetical protein ACMFMF_011765 [Clarireedia jacksonii]